MEALQEEQDAVLLPVPGQGKHLPSPFAMFHASSRNGMTPFLFDEQCRFLVKVHGHIT